MKLWIFQVLAIGFLLLFFFDAVQARICLFCKNLDRKNICKHKENTCNAGALTFCFTRKVVQDHRIIRVHRGCAHRCLSVETKTRVVLMKCCTKDYCNRIDGWNLYEEPTIPD